MAGMSKSKVLGWLRKRMAPRRKAAGGVDGGVSSSSDDRSAAPASAPSSPGRKLLGGSASALPSSLRRRKPRGNVLAALFQRVAYHLLWFVESVVVVAQLVFFFVRFGFRL